MVKVIDNIIRIQLKNKVNGIEEKVFNINDDFIKDIGTDSLDIMEIIMACENFFNVKISDKEAASINTYGELINIFEEKINATKK